MKTAIITGITGQDGSYLAELLLDEGYKVIGVGRRSSTNTHERIRHIADENFHVVEGDITDPSSVIEIVNTHQPDEFYNLAAQSHVGTSFKQPSFTFQVDAVGVLNCLEAIRVNKPDCKFYQASTSELYGSNVREDGKQCEETAFSPNSPYAAAKMAAHDLVRIYRDSYGIHASAGILFNHESERRGENFVTRKITKWVAEFMVWKDKHVANGAKICESDDEVLAIYDYDTPVKSFPKLRLGNIDAYRDWGHAADYVRAMYMMLQQPEADDYVISTGETHTVREFLQLSMEQIGVSNYEDFFVVDPQFYRPCEVEYLCGDSTKAQTVLNWKPEISFKQLVQRMLESDIENVS